MSNSNIVCKRILMLKHNTYRTVLYRSVGNRIVTIVVLLEKLLYFVIDFWQLQSESLHFWFRHDEQYSIFDGMWDGSWYDMIESYVNLNRILFKYITLYLLYWFAANLTFDGMWDIDGKKWFWIRYSVWNPTCQFVRNHFRYNTLIYFISWIRHLKLCWIFWIPFLYFTC